MNTQMGYTDKHSVDRFRLHTHLFELVQGMLERIESIQSEHKNKKRTKVKLIFKCLPMILNFYFNDFNCNL